MGSTKKKASLVIKSLLYFWAKNNQDGNHPNGQAATARELAKRSQEASLSFKWPHSKRGRVFQALERLSH